MMSTCKQTGVLVTGSPPGENGVGCNYLRDILPLLPFEQMLLCPALCDVQQPAVVTNKPLIQGPAVQLRFESGWRYGPPVLNDFFAMAAFLAKTKPWAARAAMQLLEDPRISKADHLIVVLESPQLIQMADTLQPYFQGRMTVIVWDHVDHVLQRFGHRSLPLNLLRAAFRRVIRNSVSTISVSKALADWLETISPNACHVVVPAPVVCGAESRPRPTDQRFVIGFAGSVTAPNELEGLMKALDSVDWRLGPLKAVLRLSGPRFVLSACSPRHIEYLGFLPTTAEAVQRLNECDVCFLPQPFAGSDEKLARFSFPTKLTAYLQAGCPVLVHAPARASVPTTFPPDQPAQAHGMCAVGLVSTDPNPNSLIPLLMKFVDSPGCYQQSVERLNRTRATFFSSDHCRDQLKLAFGFQ